MSDNKGTLDKEVYVIGDVQGCFQPLLDLLAKINYHPDKHQLWFTGDLVNRGPQSLETVRFIMSLPTDTVCVLGNHDLALLAVAEGAVPFRVEDTFVSILQAPDKNKLLEWIRHLPLLHYDPHRKVTLTHAGIFPFWDLAQASKLAQETEVVLRGPTYKTFLQHMYGDFPQHWDENLRGWERLRFITNAFTRMRFVTPEGGLNLTAKGSLAEYPQETPWFSFPGRRTQQEKLVFGHWAALEGKCDVPNVYALDTGCSWGKGLTALCLETNQRISVSCTK